MGPAGHGQDALRPVAQHGRCPFTHGTGEEALCPVKRRGAVGKEVGHFSKARPQSFLVKRTPESGVVPGAFVSRQPVDPITDLLCTCYTSATVCCMSLCLL